jgi:hypothetical protein
MFNFDEELQYYQKCLQAEDIPEGLSGDEVKDILDILRSMQPAASKKDGKEEA